MTRTDKAFYMVIGFAVGVNFCVFAKHTFHLIAGLFS